MTTITDETQKALADEFDGYRLDLDDGIQVHWGSFTKEECTIISAALRSQPGTLAREIKFGYVNWRGENSERRVLPISIRYGSSEYHKQTGWLMFALDLDKNEHREFSMRDMLMVDPADAILALTPSHEAGTQRTMIAEIPFDPTNHHNALKCPYCNPHGLKFAEAGTQDEVWTVRRQADPQIDDDYPPENYFEVLLPDGKWRGCVAVDLIDARTTIQKEWQDEHPAKAGTQDETEYDAIAKSWGWFQLKRGWYHVNAQSYDQTPFAFPLCYRTAKELCEKEGLRTLWKLMLAAAPQPASVASHDATQGSK